MSRIGGFHVDFTVNGFDSVRGAIGQTQGLLKGLGAAAAAPLQGLTGLLDKLAGGFTKLAQGASPGHLAGTLGAMGEAAKIASTQLEKLAGAVSQLPQQAAKMAGAVSKSMQALAGAIAPATAALAGLVTGGFYASSAGQVFGYQMQELSRQVASLFVPQIQALISYTGQLIRWFQQLSGEQQASLRNWGLLAAGVMAAALVLPRIIAGFQLLAVGMRGIGLAMTALTAHPLLLVASALALAVVSTMDWRDALKELASVAADVGKAVGRLFGDALATLRGIGGLVRGVFGSGVVGEGATGATTGKKPEPGVRGRMTGFERLGDSMAEMTISSHLYDKLLDPIFKNTRGERFGRNLSNLSSLVTAPVLETSLRGAQGVEKLLGTNALGRLLPDRRKPQEKEKEERKELMPRLGGFEAIENPYRRISEASIKATAGFGAAKTPQEDAAETLKNIYADTQFIVQKASSLRNLIA